MIQELNPGTTLWDALGTGLGSGLAALAQQKLGQLQERNQRAQTSHGLQALPGFTPEMAEQLSYLTPDILSHIVKSKLAEPSEQAYAQALLGGQPGNEQGVEMGESIAGASKVPGTERSIPRLNSKQAAEVAKLNLKKQQLSSEERRAAFKETKAERSKIVEDYDLAKRNLEDYDRLQELEDEGKLDTPGYLEGLKRAGFDIPALKNEGSQEAQKIIQNFVRGAKQVYGGRITNQEMEQFMNTLPSLSQSPEGRKRVIANLRRIAQGQKEYYKAYKEIMAENKNIPPLDLLEQVQERYDKVADKLAAQFKKDLQRPVPAGQDKLVTALQAGAGEVIGKVVPKLGSAAANAALGAAAGSAFPGLGTATGGALGALYGLFK